MFFFGAMNEYLIAYEWVSHGPLRSGGDDCVIGIISFKFEAWIMREYNER
jgi:hypothetical protein